MALSQDDGTKEIARNLDRLQEDLARRAGDAADEIASFLETYSRTHAPFTDRTGNLRGSIAGTWQYEPGRFRPDLVRIVLSAGMDYGVFVELLRNGKYAFLWPAVMENRAVILSIWQRHISAAFSHGIRL